MSTVHNRIMIIVHLQKTVFITKVLIDSSRYLHEYLNVGLNVYLNEFLNQYLNAYLNSVLIQLHHPFFFHMHEINLVYSL